MNTKQEIRERIWTKLSKEGKARFPFPIEGRIPNFEGAEEAAERLCETRVYRKADCIKVNPDAPQKPVREQVLRDDKTLLVPTPRLKGGFLRISGTDLRTEQISSATTLNGMSEFGETVPPEVLEDVDLVVCGSVAVSETGGRIGKGEGFSDLEYGILREVADHDPSVFTTVHEIQLLDSFSTDSHDVPMNRIFTPEREIDMGDGMERPEGIYWELLSEEDLEEMPVLKKFREHDQG